MVDDFEGVKLDYQFSRYRHDNSGNKVGELSAARGFPVADGSVSDGDVSDMSFIIGGNFNEDRGNVVAYATYRDIEAVLQSERDYSVCSMNGSNTGCGGSGTHDKGRFTDFSTYDFRELRVDVVHPSPLGHRVAAHAVRDALCRRGWLCRGAPGPPCTGYRASDFPRVRGY